MRSGRCRYTRGEVLLHGLVLMYMRLMLLYDCYIRFNASVYVVDVNSISAVYMWLTVAYGYCIRFMLFTCVIYGALCVFDLVLC